MMGGLSAIEVGAASNEHPPDPHSVLCFGPGLPLSELSSRVFRLPRTASNWTVAGALPVLKD